VAAAAAVAVAVAVAGLGVPSAPSGDPPAAKGLRTTTPPPPLLVPSLLTTRAGMESSAKYSCRAQGREGQRRQACTPEGW
jgi:hypothetical protein